MSFLFLVCFVIVSAFAYPWMAKTRGGEMDQPIILDTPAGPRAEKLAGLLARSNHTAYKHLPSFEGRDLTSTSNFIAFSNEDMSTTFDLVSDSLPPGRKKYIHPLGSVAGAQFIPTISPNPYTGMFQGGDSCLVRLSLAANPATVGYTPGMAMKCLADGTAASANFIAMYSLDGQETNYNFFANSFSNIIAQPTSIELQTMEEVDFKRASQCPTWLSLKQFSHTDQYGNIVANPAHPIELWLVPADIQFPTKNNGDFRHNLAAIPVGSTLWTVTGASKPGGTQVEIGKIVTTSNFIASNWGDTVLFFQHDRGEDDNCPDQ